MLTLEVEDAMRCMTAPRAFGLAGRGAIAAGNWAVLVLFDTSTSAASASAMA